MSIKINGKPTTLCQPEDYTLMETEPVVIVDEPEYWYNYCVIPQSHFNWKYLPTEYWY